MKRFILGLILLVTTIFPSLAKDKISSAGSSFIWKEQYVSNSTNTHVNHVEGFEADTSKDFPNCIKLGSSPTNRIRQGKVEQKQNGMIITKNYGIFDCHLSFKKLDIDMWLGITEHVDKDLEIYFKNDDIKSYRYYFSPRFGWMFISTNVNIRNRDDPESNYTYRTLSVTELVDAENLLQYFRGIDFSSKTAKKYKIIDNRLVPNN